MPHDGGLKAGGNRTGLQRGIDYVRDGRKEVGDTVFEKGGRDGIKFACLERAQRQIEKRQMVRREMWIGRTRLTRSVVENFANGCDFLNKEVWKERGQFW